MGNPACCCACTTSSRFAVPAVAAVHAAGALGLGRDVRLSAPALSGAALHVDASVVHLSAFHL